MVFVPESESFLSWIWVVCSWIWVVCSVAWVSCAKRRIGQTECVKTSIRTYTHTYTNTKILTHIRIYVQRHLRKAEDWTDRMCEDVHTYIHTYIHTKNWHAHAYTYRDSYAKRRIGQTECVRTRWPKFSVTAWIIETPAENSGAELSMHVWLVHVWKLWFGMHAYSCIYLWDLGLNETGQQKVQGQCSYCTTKDDMYVYVCMYAYIHGTTKSSRTVFVLYNDRQYTYIHICIYVYISWCILHYSKLNVFW